MIHGPWQAAAALASVAVLLGLMWIVRAVARARGLSAEMQRKLVHVGTGLYAMTLPWLFADGWPIFALIGVTLLVMLALRLPALGGIGETVHGVERRSWGDVLLALAVLCVFVIAQGDPVLYVLPIAILTLADAAAALTGIRYGRAFYTVEEGTKSLEGSVAFFAVSLIVSMVCLLLLSEVGRGETILLSLIVAGFATQVEAESWRGFDNFFLPAGIAVVLAGRLDATPMELAGLAALFGAMILAALRVAPMSGLSAHSARVYAIALFILVAVTALQNVVLPALVFAAHGLARRFNPSDARHPELDIVAALALVSFGWLAVGTWIGWSAVAFWGVSAAGLSAGLLALAARPAPPVLRIALPLLAAAALFVLWRWLMLFNGLFATWAGDLAPLAAASLALCVAAGLAAPHLFSAGRAGRMAALAAALPLGAYGWMTMRIGGVL